ncbi:MAG: hypothetical protein QMC67_13305 [Candidatus Wallbacteria bacterium]
MPKIFELITYVILSSLLIFQKQNHDVNDEHSFTNDKTANNSFTVNPKAECLKIDSAFYGGLPWSNKHYQKRILAERRRKEDRQM